MKIVQCIRLHWLAGIGPLECAELISKLYKGLYSERLAVRQLVLKIHMDLERRYKEHLFADKKTYKFRGATK